MNISEILAAMIFALVGGIFLVVGLFLHANNSEFMETAKSVEAEITDIRVDYDYEGDADYDVFVEFMVDNQIYSGKLDTYTSSMREGGTTTVYYNPSNPQDFRGSGAGFIGIIFAGMGGIFFLIGIGMIITKIKAKSSAKNLKMNGTLVQATITGVDLNTAYSVNGRHPYKLRASYFDSNTNKTLLFESANIWFDVQAIVDSLTIRCIDVYIDPTNPKKYYVDVEGLRNHIGN